MTTTATSHTPQMKPSLLFVDDEPSILTALRVVFRTGYDVTVTTDGFEAVELMKKRKFDVIVSDQRMPTMTGVELLRHARDQSPDSIRVLLTGYSDTDAILGAINDVEVHRFLQKPWDNSRIKQTINEAIELAQSLSRPASAAPSPAPKDEAPKKLADVVPLPVQHRAPPAAEAPTSGTAIGLKDTVLIVDAKSTLFEQTQTEMANKVNVAHAANVLDVFRTLENTPVSAMVCSFDVQSESDRTFIQMLKHDHPYILVIAVCDSTDSTRLIELINNAKIFRFIKKPVSVTLLSRYILSAVSQAEEIRKNPALIRKQQAEAMSDAVATSNSAQALREQFMRINKSLPAGIAKLLSFFRRS